MARTSKTSKVVVDSAEVVREALSLRRRGLNFDQIAVEQGVTRAGAWKRVKKGLTLLAAENLKEAEHVRDLEITRLDYLLTKLEDKIDEGDEKAIATAVRIAQRRSAMFGLDEPQKIKIEAEGIDEAAARLAEAIARRAKAKEPGAA